LTGGSVNSFKKHFNNCHTDTATANVTATATANKFTAQQETFNAKALVNLALLQAAVPSATLDTVHSRMALGLPPVPTEDELKRQQERRELAAAADAKIARIRSRWEQLSNGLINSDDPFELGQGTRMRLGLPPIKTSGELKRMASGELNKRKERAAVDDSPTAKKAKTNRELIEDDDDDNNNDDDDDEEEQEEDDKRRGGGESESESEEEEEEE
jgi:hypothetical protein